MHLLALAVGGVIALALIVAGLLLDAFAWLIVIGVIVAVAALLTGLVGNMARARRRAAARR